MLGAKTKADRLLILGEIDLIQVPISALRNEQIKGAQCALKRYWFSTPELGPFRDCNTSVEAGQQCPGIVSSVNG